MAADPVRDLDERLKPFLEVLGRKTRQTWAPLYVRGLLGPGERKSLQPMARQLGLSGHDQLQHFIASPLWDDGAVWTVLAQQAERMIGGPDAVLLIDDTALPKKGTLSVGVARQYCGQLGKQDNCQVAVSLSVANDHASLPVAYRLYLPPAWCEDAARRAKAGIPDEIGFATKTAIAVEQLRQALADGVPVGVVLADPAYGNETAFRAAVAELGLRYVLGVQSTTTVWPPGTAPLPPQPKPRPSRGRPQTRLQRPPGQECKRRSKNPSLKRRAVRLRRSKTPAVGRSLR